jgi:hypothetical protein
MMAAQSGPERFIHAKRDYARLRRLMKDADVMSKILDIDVCRAWDIFCEVIHTSLKISIPKTKPGSKKKRTILVNEKVLSKLKAKRQAYRTYLQTRGGNDYDLYASARNQAKKACREAVKELERSVASKVKQNPKAFNAYVRAKLNTRSGIANL